MERGSSAWSRASKKVGLAGRATELQTTWRFTPLLSSAKCRAAGTLLGMFAKYLEEFGKQKAGAGGSGSSRLLQEN